MRDYYETIRVTNSQFNLIPGFILSCRIPVSIAPIPDSVRVSTQPYVTPNTIRMHVHTYNHHVNEHEDYHLKQHKPDLTSNTAETQQNLTKFTQHP